MLITRLMKGRGMRFFVIERVKPGVQLDPSEFAKMAADALKYKRKLEKKGKLVGGPCLDIIADGYILETKTIEEMGEVFFNSPVNFFVDREVHPLGSYEDSLEGMVELKKEKR